MRDSDFGYCPPQNPIKASIIVPGWVSLEQELTTETKSVLNVKRSIWEKKKIEERKKKGKRENVFLYIVCILIHMKFLHLPFSAFHQFSPFECIIIHSSVYLYLNKKTFLAGRIEHILIVTLYWITCLTEWCWNLWSSSCIANVTNRDAWGLRTKKLAMSKMKV